MDINVKSKYHKFLDPQTILQLFKETEASFIAFILKITSCDRKREGSVVRI